MPLLGTGNQGFVAEQIAPQLVSAAEDLLESALRVHTVFFVEVELAKGVALRDAIDRSLGRKHIVLGTRDLDNMIRAQLADEIDLSIAACDDDRGQMILKNVKVILTPDLMMTQLQTNCRDLCEYLTHILARTTQGHSKSALGDIIRNLDQPDWIRSYLHVLRAAGNQSAHLGAVGRAEMDQEDFSLLLMMVYRLILFFRQESRKLSTSSMTAIDGAP
jgi:hypothetical protein